MAGFPLRPLGFLCFAWLPLATIGCGGGTGDTSAMATAATAAPASGSATTTTTTTAPQLLPQHGCPVRAGQTACAELP
jgi:hypothetical protein